MSANNKDEKEAQSLLNTHLEPTALAEREAGTSWHIHTRL